MNGVIHIKLMLSLLVVMLLGVATLLPAQTSVTTTAAVSQARDPGVRGGDPGAGGEIRGLTARELKFFTAGKEEFEQIDDIPEGLGPRMNLDSCGGCHAQPATGGTSPAMNPQVAFASTKDGVPFFISLDGPVREARFKFKPDGRRDGGVHNTATITGRPGAPAACQLDLPDFGGAAATNNLIFRIPTPVFGAGLIEQIPDRVIEANQAAHAAIKQALGIAGRPNRNGNDGTIARFGWKAQNQSLLLFSGEAYNVEMGITNELFQQEREQDPSCQSVPVPPVPNNVTDTEVTTTPDGLSAIEKFAFFQRFLAPPTPSHDTPGGWDSIRRGRYLFVGIGCALCHTPTLTTGDSTVAALSHQRVHLFSDLLLHNMGPGLADNILQGQAQGDEFRTAPLWGLAQRIFFLHDGRTDDLLVAIQAHKSAGNAEFRRSEANAVINNFNNLNENQKQDVLNFLRSL